MLKSVPVLFQFLLQRDQGDLVAAFLAKKLVNCVDNKGEVVPNRFSKYLMPLK